MAIPSTKNSTRMARRERTVMDASRPAPRLQERASAALCCCNLPIRARSRMRRRPPAHPAALRRRASSASPRRCAAPARRCRDWRPNTACRRQRAARPAPARGTRLIAETPDGAGRAARHAAADRAALACSPAPSGRSRGAPRSSSRPTQTLFVDGGTTTLALVNGSRPATRRARHRHPRCRRRARRR